MSDRQKVKPSEIVEWPQVDQTSKDLLAAADYIREHGWAKWSFHDGDAVCPVRALEMVTKYDGVRTRRACERFQQVIGSHPIGYNDSIFRTENDVLAALERAAK